MTQGERDDGARRVAELLRVARRLKSADDPLGAEARRRLPDSTGLSAQGVELALGDHLEVDAPPADIARLCEHAGRAPACHVVLSANVCTAALRALALALATSPVVRLRPSRRDPVLAQLLVRALQQAPHPSPGMEVTLVEEVAPAAGDELHVYGSDATIALHRERHPTAVVRGHGTGVGVAVVGADDDLARAAAAVAADVVRFDQRGCLSPRFVLVEGGPERARALAEQLHQALAALSANVPRGRLDEQLAAEIARHRSTLEALGSWLEGPQHAVGLDTDPRALPLPPAARIVHVAPAHANTARPLLDRWASWIAAIGADGDGALTEAVCAIAPRARRSALGQMQRPPLDGPVDLRPH